jgi:anti-sigma B factor antagonist
MASTLRILERHIGHVTVLELAGRLVLYDGDEQFRAHVSGLIRAGHLNLLIDLRNVHYIDSSGVGALIAGLLHVTRRDGYLKLLAPSERVAHVLEIAGLAGVLEAFADEEPALASFASPAAAS